MEMNAEKHSAHIVHRLCEPTAPTSRSTHQWEDKKERERDKKREWRRKNETNKRISWETRSWKNRRNEVQGEGEREGKSHEMKPRTATAYPNPHIVYSNIDFIFLFLLFILFLFFFYRSWYFILCPYANVYVVWHKTAKTATVATMATTKATQHRKIVHILWHLEFSRSSIEPGHKGLCVLAVPLRIVCAFWAHIPVRDGETTATRMHQTV